MLIMRISTRQAVHRLLDATGFDVRREWSSYDCAPFQEGNSLLILEAVRK